MAGEVRPLSPTNLQESVKRARTENSSAEADAAPSVEQPSTLFPGLIHASAGIEQVGPSVISSRVPKDIKTLLEVLEADKLQVDELGAAETAATFYETKEVQAMSALLPVQPSGCQNYISRYFAIEQKGAPHVKSLKSKIFYHDIRYDQIPLLRFLPFCTNLQRLKLSIEITDMKPFAEILRSLAAILKRHETLKEFKLLLCQRTRQISNNERENGSLGDLLSVLLELPHMETVQIENLLPQYDLIAGLYDSFYEKSKDKLILDPKNRCKTVLLDGGRIELNKHLNRAELDYCIGFLQSIVEDREGIKDKVSEEDMKELRPFIPEIGDTDHLHLCEINVYYANRGTVQSGFWRNFRRVDGSPLGFAPLNIQQGYLSITMEKST
ncbi:MAG: hypothetical protein JSS10_00380 [Verrucomicrobia bacterium]|nr:hypothetical protein [Verrucomicrobiota bacterium]